MTSLSGGNEELTVRAEHPPAGTDAEVAAVLTDVLAYARERDYTGWDYGDGMSSRLLRAVPFESKWLNLAVQETVKRVPVNVRPLLLVEQRRSYKGTALFAMANQTTHWLTELFPEVIAPLEDGSYSSEAVKLREWLVENQSVGYSGFCAGHKHEIQHPDGEKGVPNDPDVVSTSYAVKALVRGIYDSPEHEDVARSAAEFVVDDLKFRWVDDGAVINYHMNHPDDVFTINAGALGARLFVDLYDHTNEEWLLEYAEGLLDHIAGLQTHLGGWYYRDPSQSSHLSMDSHHNGFVIESYQRYHEVTARDRYAPTLDDALDFYRRVLFDSDGAPNFDEEHAYPRDIHAATQGILVFSYAGDFSFARKIIDWTVANMSLGDGRFVPRKYRYHTKRHVLMRWCEAWMAYALSEYLRCRHLDAPAEAP